MTDERRERPRRQVVGVRLQSPTLNGRILDVSGRGIGIETPQCVAAGELHEVMITYGGKRVTAEGAVKWSHRAAELLVGQCEVPVFRAGIELKRPSRYAAR
ncbi:MAG: PilZ domain-containing protein [Acidobacteria bacterium]|nr:PilZ domain-containing protein [Acidobacteriota bacterium]